MKDKINVPELRFPEFQMALGWEQNVLGNIFAERSRKNNPEKTVLAATQDKGVIPYELMDKSVIRDRKNLGGYKLVLPEDFVISLRSFEGGFEYSEYEGIISPAYVVLYPKIKICNYFFRIYFKQERFIRQIQNSLNNSLRDGKSISYKQASTLSIALPEIEEQQKIADCLSSLDELIELQEQKLAALKQHKKGLMQQLFPSHNDLQASKQAIVYPKLRFSQFKDDKGWEVVELNSLATRINVRNREQLISRVLTNSANEGILDQKDYFDREIANQDNLGNYYIVELGDYVYNPRTSTVAPVGPISKNKIGKGVMSPLYTVFRFKSSDNDFYDQYFKTILWHKYLYQNSNSGARHDRMNVNNDDFMAMPILDLSSKEQQKIADCLSSVDDLINEQTQKLGSLKKHKKGLMQQLFV